MLGEIAIHRPQMLQSILSQVQDLMSHEEEDRRAAVVETIGGVLVDNRCATNQMQIYRQVH